MSIDARPRAALRRALLAWYRHSARALPWRETRDPYRVWLSEIMLQQTRVETARPYYARFVQACPAVAALAAAPLARVLKLWEGLGYYTRARNLHRAAKIITTEYGGRFPTTAVEWQQLPGIGRYTAGAIASIVHGEPVPVVDGNVKRVLARLFCIQESVDLATTQARLWDLAETLLSKKHPGDFNQGLMELGARVCTPRGPRCEECPLRRWCGARAAEMQTQVPVRRARQAPTRVDVVAAVICRRGRYLLVRRPASGWLAGLWTLPGGEVVNGQTRPDALRGHVRAALGLRIVVGELAATIRHDFTHRRLHVHAYDCELVGRPPRITGDRVARWVPRAHLERYAFAAVDRKLIERVIP